MGSNAEKLFDVIWSISSLTNLEYISLVGHYAFITHGPSIDPDIYKRGYTPDQLEQLKASAAGKVVTSLNLKFTTPVEEFNIPNLGYLLTIFSKYDVNGLLPYEGTLSEQPAKVIEVFEVLDQLQAERQARHNERN